MTFLRPFILICLAPLSVTLPVIYFPAGVGGGGGGGGWLSFFSIGQEGDVKQVIMLLGNTEI